MSLSSCCVSSDELLLGHKNAQDASSGTSLSQTGERMRRGAWCLRAEMSKGAQCFRGVGSAKRPLGRVLLGQHVLPGGD